MEKLSLSGRGIYRLQAGQIGLWIQDAEAEAMSERGAVPSPRPCEALAAATAPRLGASLQHLDLSHNALESLCGLEGLSQLRVLDLSHNRLSTLRNDQGFGGGLPLTLTHLNLSHNQLVSLGNVSVLSAVNQTSRSHGGPLQALQHLAVVDVSFNRLANLRALPSESLRELEAGHNALRTLDGVEQCRQLVVLCVAHNLLKDPADVASLKALSQLRTLSMEDNPLLVRKRKLSSLLYLLPASLSETDLPIALPEPAPPRLTHSDRRSADGVYGAAASRRLDQESQTPPHTRWAVQAASPTPTLTSLSASQVSAIAHWETVARVLREELAQTKEERDALAAQLAELVSLPVPPSNPVDAARPSGFPPPPLPPARYDVALSIIAGADDSVESVCGEDGASKAVSVTHTPPRPLSSHPYDISTHSTSTSQAHVDISGAEVGSVARRTQREMGSGGLSVNDSSLSQENARHDRRNAAATVMSKLRRGGG